MATTTDRAARLADLQAVLLVITRCADLPLPFTGPDRATFWLTSMGRQDAREAVRAARDLFAAELGVTWEKRYALHSNGKRVIFWAELDGGLLIELVGRAEDVDEDTGPKVPELAGVA
jgi:hypothetical protein